MKSLDTRMLYRWSGRIAILAAFFLLTGTSATMLAQADLAGPDNIPVRITTNPQNPILGGPQLPPYSQMGTIISNAFETPSDDMILVQDSSVCATGIEGATEFQPYLKADYVYEDGRITDIHFTQIDASGERNPYSRKQFMYDEGRLTEYLYSLYDASTKTWVPDARETMLYDGDDRVYSIIAQHWMASEWVNITHNSINYSDENRVEAFVKTLWNNNQWELDQQSIAEYNENGLPTIISHQVFEQVNWRTFARETYGYDDDFSFILETYLLENYDTVSQDLQPVMREAYAYNLRGFYSDRVVQSWNDISEDWENMAKDQFAYSGIGIWREWVHQNWQNDDWQNATRRAFRLLNTLQVDLEETWDTTSEWSMNRRRFVKFDPYGNLVFEQGIELWNSGADDWTNGPNTNQCRHFWSEHMTSGNSDFSEMQADCQYMNPYLIASEIRCLTLDQHKEYDARVFDQIGRMIYQKSFLGKDAFSIQNQVPDGMYYLLISEHNRMMYQGKLVIHN